MTRETIENLARRLAASLPKGLQNVREDVEENFRAVLKSGLSRMDMVTREEFEVQQAVLQRSREKLEALEARLTELEAAPPIVKKKARKKTARKKAAKKPAGKSKPPAGD